MTQQPNIIIMYADDLGFGDLGCYGASTIPTPNLDRMAKSGVKFNRAYATAATCTPSRYSLMTGAYPWRNERAAILPGDAPLIIEPGSATMPSALKSAGYRTSVVGKWHLGLGEGNLDWNGDIHGTPLDVGFDHSFIMAATNDRVPCVYVDGRNVKDLDPSDPISVSYKKGGPTLANEIPNGRDNHDQLDMMYSHGHDDAIINGVSRIGRMAGGKAALWNDEEMAEVFLAEAKVFTKQSHADEQPFFLYYAFHQPHVPRLPGPRFKGITPHGARGDVIVEMDWCVGQMLDHLEELGIADNTLIIFSSDNGPVLDDGYVDQAEELNGEHKMAGPLRGSKYSLFDGGTRVPTLAAWPGTIAGGTTSDALLCQVDLFASLCSLAGVEDLDQFKPVSASQPAAADSHNHIEAWLGKKQNGRAELLVEGTTNSLTMRLEDEDGDWSYIPPHEGMWLQKEKNVELARSADPQLYNLRQDIGQITNIADENPEKATELTNRIEAITKQATR